MADAGTVVAAHGRLYQVEMDDGSLLACFPRGKKSHVACGDRVTIKHTADGQGVIEAVAERRNLLYRSDAFRQKLIAANITQVVIVVAAEPAFSEGLLTRCLIAAEDQGLRTVIALNKTDLIEAATRARAMLAPLAALGYHIVELSARHDPDPLRPWLAGQRSVLVGQSGMGKSTLINALVPAAEAATREISTALDSGKHTTTHVSLYHLDAGSDLLDSPGMQEFGLHHLSRADLEHAFREFRPFLDQCRFRNCRHDAEPGCALQAAVIDGQVSAARHAQFVALCNEMRV